MVHKSTTHLNFARWTSGLSRLPFTEKSMGSNPIRVTKILAPWLNGYNTALSRRVVRVRIPLGPPKESSLKKLIVIASTEVVDKLRRLRIDMAHCRCTIKLKKAVKIGNRRVHQHYQHYCVVPLRKECIRWFCIVITHTTQRISTST